MQPDSGILTPDEISATATSIAGIQQPNGMIPWFKGGHCDPWNHIECAMALDLAGSEELAENAYRWLAAIQLENGAWYQYYISSFVEVDRQDTNCVAYFATGIWHHYLTTGDETFLSEMWEVLRPAVDFVLDLQTSRGEVIWARHRDGNPFSFSLLTGSCSIYHSLNMAINIAEAVDDPKPDWELAAETLGKVISSRPEAFVPKKQWAMDWYYPVLTGVITGESAIEHLNSKEDIFYNPERGIRCVSNRPWFTAAETAECTMAYLNAGDLKKAEAMFAATSMFRQENGSYYTGLVHPTSNSSNSAPLTFPDQEITTYTAAAVLLAAAALKGDNPTADIFAAQVPATL